MKVLKLNAVPRIILHVLPCSECACFHALSFGALHPPTDKRKLNPEREVEERQIPVWNNKPDSKPLINGQQQIVIYKKRKR
ncbi:hypothetical protein Riv7116_0063 [Rivularia sp. PCC 7116]|nr:hypothetical protein Riv7116_0063 [Rivularia sp. PCC 7116]